MESKADNTEPAKFFSKEWWRSFYKKYLTQFPDFLQYLILLLGGLIMLFFL